MADRDEMLRKLVDNMYTRNDQALGRGTFRVRGETLEVFPAYAETAYRAVFFGDEIEAIQHFDPLTGEVFAELEHAGIWPATHYATDRPTIERAVVEIRDEMEARCAELEQQGKLLESHRLRQRTQFDMEMLRELGFCNGIENYSRILDGRAPGERPFCLLDFFPDDFVCFIDESHQTVPQIGGMYEGDRSRKTTLVEYGFRLPSALDNRPQTFDEFLQHTPQMVFVSATPADFERNHSSRIVEQIVRPTGVVDPEVDVRETKNQIDDLMEEIRQRVEVEERTLVTTLTKKMAEDLTDYLLEYGFKVRYLHSEIDTLERIQIIRELRLGEYDVLVGVNLLREGLDLPEVSLVAILDADKEGFLRGETSLIQTIGRAARNIRGKVIMYADKETAAMRTAIEETDRRRAIQVAYNEEHGITPETIQKGISDISDFLMTESKVPAEPRAAGAATPRACRPRSSAARSWSWRRRCSPRPTTSASSTPRSCATRSRRCATSWTRPRRTPEPALQRRSRNETYRPGCGTSGTSGLLASSQSSPILPPPRRRFPGPRPCRYRRVSRRSLRRVNGCRSGRGSCRWGRCCSSSSSPRRSARSSASRAAAPSRRPAP